MEDVLRNRVYPEERFFDNLICNSHILFICKLKAAEEVVGARERLQRPSNNVTAGFVFVLLC